MHDVDIPAENDLHKLAMEIRRDLTRAQGKLTELMRQIGEAKIENRPTPTVNGPGHYVPGQLRFLKQSRGVWKYGGHEDDARERTRLYLEGFTENEAEIAAHLDALTTATDVATKIEAL